MSKDFSDSRKSSRLRQWNYGWKGIYFVTITTKFGENYFGEISNGVVHLNSIGEEVYRRWLCTPMLRPDMNIKLDEFVVMPNHFHGIIEIGRNKHNDFIATNPEGSKFYLRDYSQVEYQYDEASLFSVNRFGPQTHNLAAIVRGFKASVSSWCRSNNKLFDWHSRYHDVIIQHPAQLYKIRNYIRNNPANWHKDRFNKG